MVYVPSGFPRSIFMLWSFCTLGLAIKSPTSLTAVLAERAHGVGVVTAAIFSLCLMMLFLDFLVNDLLPDSYRLEGFKDYRWLLISTMSSIYWMYGTIAMLPGAAPEGSWVLIASYLGVGAWGMTFAFHSKVRKYQKEMAVHDESQRSQLA